MSCTCSNPWSVNAQSSSDAYIQTQAKAVTDGLQALPSYQNIASLGIASGITNLAITKGSIETALKNIATDTNCRNTCAASLVSNNNANANTAALNETIGQLAPVVEQQKTIYELRKEQAASLANKYASNAYSSWWPLWFPMGDAKPLGDVTRTILYMFTAGSLIFVATQSASGASSAPNDQTGGSRVRKIRR
jgi:hypothetical protein